jgi:hypothetical protein
MSNEEPPQPHRSAKAALIGVGALAAWFAMLWFMFGDVL